MILKVLAYILDEEDFEHIPTINRGGLKFIEIRNEKVNKNVYSPKRSTNTHVTWDDEIKQFDSEIIKFDNDE